MLTKQSCRGFRIRDHRRSWGTGSARIMTKTPDVKRLHCGILRLARGGNVEVGKRKCRGIAKAEAKIARDGDRLIGHYDRRKMLWQKSTGRAGSGRDTENWLKMGCCETSEAGTAGHDSEDCVSAGNRKPAGYYRTAANDLTAESVLIRRERRRSPSSTGRTVDA